MIGRKEFTTGEKQLRPVDTEDTRRVAAVRVYVERVIAMVRQNYITLKSIILVSLLHSLQGDTTSVYKLGKVCYVLCNVCQSVISAD